MKHLDINDIVYKIDEYNEIYPVNNINMPVNEAMVTLKSIHIGADILIDDKNISVYYPGQGIMQKYNKETNKYETVT